MMLLFFLTVTAGTGSVFCPLAEKSGITCSAHIVQQLKSLLKFVWTVYTKSPQVNVMSMHKLELLF